MKDTHDIMQMGESNPNYLGSFDLYDLTVQELTLTISKIQPEQTVVNGGAKEMVTACHFEENYKPMILNITNKKRIAKIYGTTDERKLVGKRITIVIEKVKARGKICDALRVKEVVPAAVNVPAPKCEECGGDIEAFGSMNAQKVASYTKERYGKSLCSRCATKAKEDAEKASVPEETSIVNENADSEETANENN